MAQTFDGASAFTQTDTGNVTTPFNVVQAGAFSCTQTNDVCVVEVYLEQQDSGSAGGAAASVNSITPNPVGGTWVKQSAFSYHSGVNGNCFVTIEKWSAFASAAFTSTVTVNIVPNGGATILDDVSLLTYAVNGCRTSAPFWDPGANASLSAHSDATSAPTVTGYTSTYDKGMILAMAACGDNTSDPGTNTIGSGFIIIDVLTNAANFAWLGRASEQRIVAVAQSGISPAFGTSWPGWIMSVDMLLDAAAVPSGGGSPAVVLGLPRRQFIRRHHKNFSGWEPRKVLRPDRSLILPPRFRKVA